MKKKNLIIISALILISGLSFYFLQTGPGMTQKTSGEKSGQESSVKPQPAAEHEGHTADRAQPQGKIEVSEEQKEKEAPTVEISPEKQQLIGVRTAEVSAKHLKKIIRTVGRIEYDETKLATVNTKIEGWIEKLYVDYTGRHVKKGEPLVEIYSPELIAAQQEFLNLIKWRSKSETKNSKSEIEKMLSKDAEVIIEAAKQRLRLWDISDAQIQKIEESGKPVRTLTIYSPVNGYVVQKTALQGMRIMPGEKLFDVADLSSVWVISDIYEYELSLISTGQQAVISLSYFPGKEFSAKIEYIYPTLSGETRTAKVRFSIPNPGGQLRPQMFTNVEIKIDLGRRLAVPREAVIDTGTRKIVYVDKGDGYFEPREVLTGLRAEELIEILKGLNP